MNKPSFTFWAFVFCWLIVCAAALSISNLRRQVAEFEARPPEIVTEYVEVFVEKTKPYYSDIALSDADRDLLAKIVFLEAGNQSLTGQRCVVEVVFNRVLDERFPNTIRGVLSQRNQFSTYKNVGIAKPTQEQYDAIDTVLKSTQPILATNTVFFAKGTGGRTLYERIGAHYFCT